jgi:hypothetical protein
VPEELRPMTRWRTALAVLMGLLLPVPLLLLFGSVPQVGPEALPPQRWRVSPVLGFEERMRRVTYERECRKGSDCEEPLGCLRDRRTRRRYCTDSECSTDEQCPEGQTCQSLPTLDDGPLVRYCIPLGVRQAGEECFQPPSDKKYACGPGLVCAGQEGWCGRPCQEEAGSCPEGFFCADVAPQPVCLPSCEARGCPAGQQCVLYKEGVSRCAVVYGPNCQHTPCPEGRKCDVFDVADQPDKVWMECVEPCGEGKPPCPEGRACDITRCQPACDPQTPGMCAEGYRCERSKPKTPWVCQPDV